MDNVLLMAGSITHAQRMAAMLERQGIRAVISRTPTGVDPRGCGYGVKVSSQNLEQAQYVLRHSGIMIRGIYEKVEGTWREVPT